MFIPFTRRSSTVRRSNALRPRRGERPGSWTLILLSGLVAACQQNPPARSVSDAWQDGESRSSTAPAQPPRTVDAGHSSTASQVALSNGPNVASVNGRVITRDWLARELIASHGLNLLAQKIALEVVREEGDKARLTVAPAEIDAEYDLTLRLGAMTESERQAMTPQRRAQLIAQWRLSRGVSEEELRLAMHRQALLRKLATARLTINESMLREEFARVYGTKVECRHIVVASIRDADKLRPHLDAGEDFAALARRHSINNVTAPDGGLLPPFAKNDETIPAVLREAAFRMEPGQVSNPIQVNGQIHLLKLERRIEPTIIKFESVRDAVATTLRERLIPVQMEKLLAALQQQAILKIDDPLLRQQYQEGLKSGRVAGPPLGG